MGQPKFFRNPASHPRQPDDSEQYEPRTAHSERFRNTPSWALLMAPTGNYHPTGSEGATNTFKGDGGPKIGNIFSRLLYAIRFGSDQILPSFSDRVNANSQIL